VILVTGLLADLGLTAELGVNGLDRQAVGLRAAVTASLADALIDEGPHRWIRNLAGFRLRRSSVPHSWS
jgi:hypothetical protein